MWTKEQDDLLRLYYPSKGSDIKELSQFTRAQIRNRAFKLGVVKSENWTSEEISLLQESYNDFGSQIPGLSHKSKASIHGMARKLGLACDRRWTADEDALIRDKYPMEGDAINELSYRTKSSIRLRASILGVKKESTKSSSNWTSEYIAVLKENYEKCGADIPELRRIFSHSAIVCKAESLGLHARKSWSADELGLLRKYYSKYGSHIPGLDRSPRCVTKKAAQLGLSCAKRPNLWTDEEIVVLRESFENGIVPVFETHTLDSIKSKASSLGLLPPRRWSDAELEILKSNYENKGPGGMLDLLPGRTYQQIVTKANRLGLTFSRRFRARSNDVKKIVSTVNDFLYCTCAVCGKVFLIYGDEYKIFSHDTHGTPIPDGWNVV